MVNLKEEGAVTAKIIDLGLAKPATDTPADPAISLPGAFAGTPEFASPEQGDRRRSVFAWRNPLGDADGQNTIPRDAQ